MKPTAEVGQLGSQRLKVEGLMIEEEGEMIHREGERGMKDGEHVVKFQMNLDIQIPIGVTVMESEIGEITTTSAIIVREMVIDRLRQVDLHRPLDREIYHDQSLLHPLVGGPPNRAKSFHHQRPSVEALLVEQVVVGIAQIIVP